MNYTGTVLGKIETNFLKEALLKLSEKCRLGQNCEYEKRENKYKDVGTGTLENFAGQEELFINNKSIYKFEYHGGLI